MHATRSMDGSMTSEADLRMFSMLGRTGASQKGAPQLALPGVRFLTGQSGFLEGGGGEGRGGMSGFSSQPTWQPYPQPRYCHTAGFIGFVYHSVYIRCRLCSLIYVAQN